MCGFFIEIKKKKFHDFKKKFSSSAQLLSHRGDDKKTFYYDENVRVNFFRLKIRDLSSNGRQPMLDYSGRYLIVFNGEIYNTQNIIKYLPKIKLRGNSDTEILVNLYSKYKQKVLDMIEGMFSFVVYDKQENECFIARDRFGIKPLYFYQSKLSFIISWSTHRNEVFLNNFKKFIFFFINTTKDTRLKIKPPYFII